MMNANIELLETILSSPKLTLLHTKVRDFKDGTKYALGNDSPVPL